MANATSPTNTDSSSSATASLAKRRKLVHNDRNPQPSLLPGLPDHIAHLCLSRVHPASLYSVCRSWRRLIYSSSFPPFLSLYALLSQLDEPSSPAPDHSSSLSRIEFATFDPVSSRWLPLPPPLPDQPLSILLRHRSFLSRIFPIQSVAVSGNLVLLAATANNFFPAIPCPLVFNPTTRAWSAGPPLSSPRRWCTAGVFRGAVYVGSGVGSQFSADVARSFEKWDLNGNDLRSSAGHAWKWQKLRELKDIRFSRDAIEAVGWRGKLCMVNVKGGAVREGIVYDVAEDIWEEMPKGMIGGWKGPAAAMDEAELYAVDEANGSLRRYDPERDEWDDVIVSAELKGAQQIAAAGGRVCALSGDAGCQIVVVDAAASPPRTWVVETPKGSRAVSVHIMPRMSQQDDAYL
ncbi:F-box/kelch-repeat protein SKIP25 [Punica granatum]|uniref:F-box/kelch-repeat protein SKIP25 n=2 Tax=Punica granatum TaxID=22663 RepID=A0A6P8CXN5_PUNGR|nr:F-box/kelch-repeat protein SKIP25 [Punica granatum]XP_031389517.1 F-box/kelch-repeat protein SKIP25 [Punica granatum]OWM65024.1 hypothetical protein CDL15_Pgr028742 [Punica granatum]PKI44030.1 hypothetical protein CRG98_035560 [Punica granatum]